jgi:para-nitrobenzyl esterase
MDDVAKRNVPLIIGTNEDEGTLFTLILPQDATDEEVASSLTTVGDPGSVIAAYRARGTGRPILVDLMTDAVFRIPSLRVADAAARAGVPVWVYLFTWKTPVFGGFLGATHALELPFVWDALDDEQWKQLLGEAPPRAIADAMQDAWLSFAKTGDPNTATIPVWPTYDPDTRPTLELDDEIRVTNDPGSELRELWYAHTKDSLTV